MAKIANDVLGGIYRHHSAPGPIPYSKDQLSQYESSVNTELKGNFFKSQNGSQDLFLTPGAYQQTIWDAYIKAINEYQQVRKNIYLAWVDPELKRYPLENDEYCGEKIFFSLPLSARVALTPYFLKLKFFGK